MSHKNIRINKYDTRFKTMISGTISHGELDRSVFTEKIPMMRTFVSIGSMIDGRFVLKE